MIIDYPWYLALCCLLLGALYAAVLYFVGRRPFRGAMRWLLAGLRFLAVSAIAFLLLAPVAKQTRHERQQPHVLLLQDVSTSLFHSPDSSFSMEDLTANLGKHFRVSYETFGGKDATDISEALLRHAHDDVDAVVLATDGIYNRGANPATIAERLTVPVYTIALGDTTPRRDAALAGLNVNRIAMLGNRFPVEVTVNADLLRGHQSTLAVSDASGRRLFSQQVAYSSDNFSEILTFSLSADEPGLQRFTVNLAPVDGELTEANNHLSFYVDVIDTRRKVALFARAPHPDIAALKRAIESNPNYEVTVFLTSDLKKWNNEGYSMAVLHNLPSRDCPDISFAAGLPCLYVIGLQTDLPRFNALHSGLEIVSKVNKGSEVTALWQESFSLFSLDAADADAIVHMPPLTAPFGEARLSDDVQTLFTARLGAIDTRQPLVAASAQGEYRRAFIWGEGLWRWRLADYASQGSHDRFDRLVSQLVGFTAMQHQRDRLQVEAERSYAEGDPPVLRAQLYNEAYELTNASEVSLRLTGDSVKSDYAFLRDGTGYRLVLPVLPQGLYRYTAVTPDGLTAEGSFAVEALNLEQRRLVADHNLLRTISATTGGEMYYPAQLSTLESQLSTLKPTIHTHTRYAELLRMGWVLALIVLFLAAEWVLRKYHGEL